MDCLQFCVSASFGFWGFFLRTLSCSQFVIITKMSNSCPSAFPFGRSKCCGQPFWNYIIKNKIKLPRNISYRIHKCFAGQWWPPWCAQTAQMIVPMELLYWNPRNFVQRGSNRASLWTRINWIQINLDPQVLSLQCCCWKTYVPRWICPFRRTLAVVAWGWGESHARQEKEPWKFSRFPPGVSG